MKIDWKPSPHFNRIPTREIKGIVIHTAECQEKTGARWGILSWLVSKLSKASAHYIVDDQGIAQCVRDWDVAWHAGKVNAWTIGIELAGSAKQTSAQWDDAYSRAVLKNAAWLVAKLAAEHKIPIARLDDVGILMRSRGLFGHVDANRAHGKIGKGAHWDPGPNFPWDSFISQCRDAQTCA